MGPWGLHYERTETWWEQSRAWHEYLARCQYLLQQGRFVADVCYLQPEGAPRRFAPPSTAMIEPYVRGGYNFDGCTPEALLTRMSVKDGRIVLPDGMSYRVLVLPQVETMTPALLGKIKDLLTAGATVVAPCPPQKAPGLTDYPACDVQVHALAAEVWGGNTAPATVTERAVGKGRILWGGPLSPKTEPPTNVLPDFGAARWIWYPEGNPAASAPPGKRYFRRVVKLEPGSRVASAQLVMTADNEFICYINGRRVGSGEDFHRGFVMNVKPELKPGENLIAVDATNTTDTPNPAGLIARLSIKLGDGRTVEVSTDGSWQASRKPGHGWSTATKALPGWFTAMDLGPLGMAPWGEIEAAPMAAEVYPPMTALYDWLAKDGLPPDFRADRPLRHIHRRIGDAEVYFVANGAAETLEAGCSFRVAGKQPELWYPETGRIMPFLQYEEKDGCTMLRLRLGPSESVFVVFRRPPDPARQIVSLRFGFRVPAGVQVPYPFARMRNELTEPCSCDLQTADGRSRNFDCRNLAAPRTIGGPWEVAFDPQWGGPAKVTFESLGDWSKRREPGIKYYSGAAVYRTTFKVRPEETKLPHCALVHRTGQGGGHGGSEGQRPGPRHCLEGALSPRRDRGDQARREPPGGEGRQSLDQSPDR